MTEKLYYSDSHIKDFAAKVTACLNAGDRWRVCLDRTAFFPEGGGQAADTGTIGEAAVLDVQEEDGKIVHYTAAPLEVGAGYNCCLDWEQRFRRMQNHSGEHIVSGIINSRFGFDNVGFHMSDDHVIMDYNGELTGEELTAVELAANRAVWENVPVRAEFPPVEELQQLEYRSKLKLSENVRIVTIAGYDVCACCAPHVKNTGEIGVIKLVDCMRHRGGVRIKMLCGSDAYCDYAALHNSAGEISALLSARRSEISAAVERMHAELEKEKYQNVELKRSILVSEAEKITVTEGNLCFFYPSSFDINSLRGLVNAAVKRCTGIVAAFSGNDEAGYNYVMGSAGIDLRAEARAINTAICGRGGGSTEMIQGNAKASRTEIEKYFNI